MALIFAQHGRRHKQSGGLGQRGGGHGCRGHDGRRGDDRRPARGEDATDVYFVSQFVGSMPMHVMKAPKAGGPATTLASDMDWPKRFALGDDAAYLLVSNEATGELGYIARIPKAGGPAVKLVTGTMNPRAPPALSAPRRPLTLPAPPR